jgi:cytochrome P450
VARLPRFDARDPVVLEDPYPTYAQLRSAGPLCRGGPGQWVVPRYAEVAALLRDRRLSHQFPEEYYRFSVGEGPASDFLQRIVLDREPPDHTRLRRLFSKAFGASLVGRMSDHIGELVDGLLAPALERDYLDAATDLAFPLPLLVVCELMGIPATRQNEVRPRAMDLGKAFVSDVAPEDRDAANSAVVSLREYLGELVEDRARRPGDDLLSRMLAVEEGGETLSREEVVDNAVFLFFAGFETSMGMIATGCAALLSHPEQLARLRKEPSLVPSAVEEFLRFDAPIQGAGRLVRVPVEIGGRTIRPGRVLVLLLGSANHDPNQFAEPDQLDVGRDPNPHVSFGGGIHHCLGASLARVEGRVVFERLLRRFAVFEPAAEPVRQRNTTLRTYGSIPIHVRPGGRVPGGRRG